MDLQLTRRGDYTLRAAICLARATPAGAYRKLREIAAEMAIPERYTHEIVSLLVRAGLAEAMAGKLGGYRLVREPAGVSLLEVIEAGEGSLRVDRCALSGGPCRQQAGCAVHAMLEEAVQAMITSLGRRNLSQVLDVDASLAQHASRKAR